MNQAPNGTSVATACGLLPAASPRTTFRTARLMAPILLTPGPAARGVS